MPPRRSCFFGPQVGYFRYTSLFQCHHGVPTSLAMRSLPMPPPNTFQCHHGVPASGVIDLLSDDLRATTAFLLRGRGGCNP
jgi:hypothetical protein